MFIFSKYFYKIIIFNASCLISILYKLLLNKAVLVSVNGGFACPFRSVVPLKKLESLRFIQAAHKLGPTLLVLQRPTLMFCTIVKYISIFYSR